MTHGPVTTIFLHDAFLKILLAVPRLSLAVRLSLVILSYPCFIFICVYHIATCDKETGKEKKEKLFHAGCSSYVPMHVVRFFPKFVNVLFAIRENILYPKFCTFLF